MTWEEYISQEVVSQFEAEYKAKVNFIYFESDDARDEMMINMPSNRYDLILLDKTNIPMYKKLDWISTFNTNLAPNISYAQLPEFSNSENNNQICTPYSWGTAGIAYRKDLVTEPIISWKQLYTPVAELQGKILMSSLSKEVVGFALKSLGYSMSSSNRQELEEARQLLLAQSSVIAGYSPVAAVSAKSKLVTGEVSAVLTYSGDALMLKELSPQIEYTLPVEGGGIWADFICLSAKTKNPELAHKFIDFINRPRQAANNALYIFSATPNSEAEKLLPDEFLNNPIIYPSKALVAQSETYSMLSPRTMKKHNAIMRELNKRVNK